ncbi:MAG: glycosyltransferase family 4 protein, partial [Candidatus Jettenia caeni]|nr:glycosyltransferase family 4 protein [Candidatus Jettenia caeni]
VVTIQNIEPFSNTVSKGRGFIQNVRLKLLKFLTSLSIKKSQIVIFPSTKARIDVEKSGIVIKRSEVVYHGINKKIFHPHNEDDRLHHLKGKYGLDKFILYVSNIQRYKNFLELVKAFVLLKDKIDNNIQLVFAGKCFDREYYHEMKAFIRERRYDDRVIFLGNIPSEELPYLYSACKLFVFPSTCESFGMTLVEAMACGAPILASQTEPMPEICADAAIYFDPMNTVAMADIISKTLKDQELISVLTKKARERAKTFSWENTIIRTLKIFESIG